MNDLLRPYSSEKQRLLYKELCAPGEKSLLRPEALMKALFRGLRTYINGLCRDESPAGDSETPKPGKVAGLTRRL